MNWICSSHHWWWGIHLGQGDVTSAEILFLTSGTTAGH